MKKSTRIKGLSIFIILFVVINYLTINIVPAEQLELSESKTTGKINNIVVFLKFADDEDAYNNKYDEIKEVFNKNNGNSLKHYIKTMSNNKLTVDSTFYPLDDNGNVYAYEVNNNASYYEKISEDNPYGYSDFDGSERERELLIEALTKVKNQIPKDLNIDHDNDGVVDSIVFIQPRKTNWGEILWSHKDEFVDEDLEINRKKLGYYTLVSLEDLNSYGVLSHEYLHILGLNDLYSSTSEGFETRESIPNYDPEQRVIYESIMATNEGVLTNYERKKLNWISDIKTLTEDGTYTLIPSLSSEKNGNIAYKIPIPYDSSRYFILEYRAKGTTKYDDEYLEGLFIYGVDENVNGNISSPPYEVYSMSDFNRENYADYQSSFIAKNDYDIDGYEEYLKNGFNAFTLNDGNDNLGISITNVSFKNGKVTFKLTLNKEKGIEAPKNFYEEKVNGYEIKLSWESQEYFIDEYFIYRDGIFIGKTKNTEYIDKFEFPLPNGRVYNYSVKAVSKKYGESELTSRKVVARNNSDFYEIYYPVLRNESLFMKTENEILEMENCLYKGYKVGRIKKDYNGNAYIGYDRENLYLDVNLERDEDIYTYYNINTEVLGKNNSLPKAELNLNEAVIFYKNKFNTPYIGYFLDDEWIDNENTKLLKAEEKDGYFKIAINLENNEKIKAYFHDENGNYDNSKDNCYIIDGAGYFAIIDGKVIKFSGDFSELDIKESEQNKDDKKETEDTKSNEKNEENKDNETETVDKNNKPKDNKINNKTEDKENKVAKNKYKKVILGVVGIILLILTISIIIFVNKKKSKQ